MHSLQTSKFPSADTRSGEMPAWSDAVHRAELVLSANIKDAQAAVQTQLEAQKDELLESLRKQQSANVSKMMLPLMLPPSLQAEIATQNARIYKTMQSILQSQTETRNLLRHGGIITQGMSMHIFMLPQAANICVSSAV